MTGCEMLRHTLATLAYAGPDEPPPLRGFD